MDVKHKRANECGCEKIYGDNIDVKVFFMQRAILYHFHSSTIHRLENRNVHKIRLCACGTNNKIIYDASN